MFASRGPRARRLLGRGAAILIFFWGGDDSILLGGEEGEGEDEEWRNGFLLVGGGDWLVGWDCGWGLLGNGLEYSFLYLLYCI